MVIFQIRLTDDEVKQCKEFANNSSRSQREYRSGGNQFRNGGQIFFDTFRGKVGELAVTKFLSQEPFLLKNLQLDFDVYPRGEWDSSDIEIGNKRLSVKSSKHFARWLLLESKDIQRGNIFDYYILVLVDEDFKSATIKGYATKDEIILPNVKTLRLRQGEPIPGTRTALDANNHGRRAEDLHNTLPEWEDLISNLK